MPEQAIPNRIAVNFEYSAEEHMRAFDELPHRRAMARWWIPGTLAVFVLMFGATALMGDYSRQVLTSSMVLTLPVIALSLFIPAAARRAQIARLKKVQALSGRSTETRAFGNEGFTPRSDVTQPVPWSMITQVSESEAFFLVYTATSDVPEYVPKRALSTADLQGLRAMLAEQFRNRRSSLRLLSGHG